MKRAAPTRAGLSWPTILLSLSLSLSLLSLAGCTPPADAPPATRDAAEPEPPAQAARFPTPPAARGLGMLSEDEGTLDLAVGPADADGRVPVRTIRGPVVRRVSVLGSADDGSGLDAFYRERIEAGGYTHVFECEGIEACGGQAFVSQVIDAYVTAPRNVQRAPMVIALMQPSGPIFRHVSLSRSRQGGEDLVSVTISGGGSGPVVVMTQQATGMAAPDRHR